MTLRACVYKNCDNFINLKYRTDKDVKLFSFPRNPERRKQWIELGKVSSNIPESMHFFCSDHFDKKYMSITTRRTILVGEAMPFSCVEALTGESEKNEDDNFENCLYEVNDDSEDEQDILDGQDLHVESISVTNELDNSFHDEQQSINLDMEEHVESVIYTDDENDNPETSIASYKIKRKHDMSITHPETESSESKMFKPSTLYSKAIGKPFEETNERTNHQSSAIESTSNLAQTNRTLFSCQEINEDEMDADLLVDENHITTFISKGEEYVEMRKEYYINEKMHLLEKLRKMEHTLKVLKEHLNAIDI